MIYDDIALFVAVARDLSFAAAARSLKLPASTVSRRVAELEDGLGVKLFERTTRRVRLTEDGRALLDRCEAAIETLQGALAPSARTGIGGVMHITAPPLAARTTVGPYLLSFAAANPQVSIRLVTTNTLLDFVRDGIDLAFRLGPLEDSELIVRPLWPVPYAVCASRALLDANDLADTISPTDLAALPAISTGQEWGFVETADFEQPCIAHVFDDLELAYAAVRKGLGVGYLPREMVTADCVITVAGMTPLPHTMNIVYPSRRLLPKRVRALIDHITLHSGAALDGRDDQDGN